MIDRFRSLLTGKKAVPLGYNDFIRSHGSEIRAVQQFANALTEKQISLVSNQDISFHQGAPKEFNDKVAAKKYNESIWIHVACSLISESIASLPLKVYRKENSGDGIVYVEHTQGLAYELFQKPSLYQTPNEFKLSMASTLCYAGNSYLYVDPKQKEIWSLLPQHVKIVADRIDFIDKYVFSPSGNYESVYSLPPEQVVHVKNFNSEGYFYGTSPLQAAYKQCLLTDMDQNYWLKFWRNGGRVMGAWKVDQALSKDSYERFEQKIKQRYKGLENMFRDILLERGMSFEQIGVSQKDAQLIQKYKLSRDDILAAYKVPSSLANVLELANYSNMEVQESNFWKLAVLPRISLIEEALGANSILSEGGRLCFEFDLSSVEVLQRNEKDKAELSGILIEKSIMTPNEVRKRYWDLDPIEIDGDILKPVASTGNIFGLDAPVLDSQKQKLIEQVLKTQKDLPVNEPKAPLEPKTSKDQRDVIAKAFDETLEEYDSGFVSILKKRFGDQREKVLQNIRKIFKDKGSISSDDMEEILSGLTEGRQELALDFRVEMKKITNKFGAIAVDAIEKQLKSIKSSYYRKDLGFDEQDPAIAKYLAERSVGLSQITDETTLEFIRDGIAAQMKSDSSVTAVSNYVSSFFDGMETWRANRIARTETASAANKSMYHAWLQNDDVIEQKEWVTARDSFVRDSHSRADGQAVPLRESFTLGSGVTAIAPNQTGVASEDINCRCTMAVIVKE